MLSVVKKFGIFPVSSRGSMRFLYRALRWLQIGSKTQENSQQVRIPVHTHKLNRSRPFYLLSIPSKKINSSEFHKQIQHFELPTSWDFFLKGKKSREALPKRIAHSSNTSRPFYL